MEGEKNKKTISQELASLIRSGFSSFGAWLKPSPDDHWSLQSLKILAKIPVVLLAVALSPLLLVVLLLVFLIAL